MIKVLKMIDVTMNEIVAELNERGLQELIIAATQRLQELLMVRTEPCNHECAESCSEQQNIVGEVPSIVHADAESCSGSEESAPQACKKSHPNKRRSFEAAKAANKGFPNGKAWTDDDLKYLRIHYPTAMSVEAIAEQLGHTAAAVNRRASDMGLRRPRRMAEFAALGRAARTTKKQERLAEQVRSAEDEVLAAIADEQPDAEDAMAHVEREPAAVQHTDYSEHQDAHSRAIKLAKKYGRKAMEGTPVVVDSKTVVIKRAKKGEHHE